MITKEEFFKCYEKIKEIDKCRKRIEYGIGLSERVNSMLENTVDMLSICVFGTEAEYAFYVMLFPNGPEDNVINFYNINYELEKTFSRDEIYEAVLYYRERFLEDRRLICRRGKHK